MLANPVSLAAMPDMNPMTVVLFALVGGLVLLVGLTLLSLMRAFLRGMRSGKALPDMPVVDPNPPADVVETAALRMLAWVALGWGLFNAAMIVVWLIVGSHLLQPPVHWLLSTYVMTSSVVMVIGAIMLLAGRRYGRRGVAWGCMLMGVMSFSGSVMFVVFFFDPESQRAFREVAVPTAIFLGVHMVADIALGALAQRVGVAPYEDEDFGVVPPEVKAPLE